MSAQPQFGDEFIRRVLHWSIVCAALAGVVGWLVTTQVVAAVAVWVGAAVDIYTFRELAFRGRHARAEQGSAGFPTALLLWRIASKAVLLVLAVLLPWPTALWGVVAGVLVVETMLVVVGVVSGISNVFHHGSGSGREVRS